MKKIDDFLNENFSIENNKLNLLYGGDEHPTSYSNTSPDHDGDGCCSKCDTTDSFQDCNGNGEWDEGEEGTKTTQCYSVSC